MKVKVYSSKKIPDPTIKTVGENIVFPDVDISKLEYYLTWQSNLPQEKIAGRTDKEILDGLSAFLNRDEQPEDVTEHYHSLYIGDLIYLDGRGYACQPGGTGYQKLDENYEIKFAQD